MIEPIFLIIFFTVFFFISFSLMIHRGDDLHALAYLVLFVYTIFGQIGYSYYPELSQDLNAYFGQELFYDYWLFMFLSFFLSFILYLLLNSRSHRKVFYRVRQKEGTEGRIIFYVLTIIFIGTMAVTYFIIKDEIRYGGGEYSLGNEWFALGFRFLALVIMILYAHYRLLALRPSDKRCALVLFIVSVALFVQIGIKAGSRGDLLFLVLGIAMFELHPFIHVVKRNKRKLLISSLLMLPMLYFFEALEYVRFLNISINFGLLWDAINHPGEIFGGLNDLVLFLLSKDYYAPSHTLFVSMAYGIVDAGEVLKSNIANSFVGLRYPSLSETVAGRVVYQGVGPGVGWAYHLFTEGYNIAGWFGVLYNAIFWNLFMYVWNLMASSNSKKLNLTVTALMAILIAHVMRFQNALFLRYIWLYLLPSLGLLFLSNGWYPVLYKKKANGTSANRRKGG